MLGAQQAALIGRARGGGAAPWSPLSLSNLISWHDAADTGTLWTGDGSGAISNGALIYRWDDKSGNGRHLRQTVSANRYTYDATSKCTVSADSTDFMNVSFGATFTQPNTIILQFANLIDVINNFCDGYDSTHRHNVNHYRNYKYLRLNAGTERTQTTANQFGGGKVRLYAIFNGTSSRLIMRRRNSSGVAETVDLTGWTSPGTHTFTGFALGARYDGIGIANAGSVKASEVILLNESISDANRALVDSYLVGKWGDV